MSKFQLQPGRGSLTSVREKRNPKGPDFTGTLMLLDGTTIKIACWERTFNWGTALSLSIDTRDQQPYPREAKRRDGGDVPF